MMKYALFSLLMFGSIAHANASLDFNFKIKGDHFHLEINQNFNKPVHEIRKNLSPTILPEISNLVRKVEEKREKDSTRLSIQSRKYGLSNTTVLVCNEKDSGNEYSALCNLDIDSGDTYDFFNFGTETITCTNTPAGSSCKFIMEASVKSQRKFIFYRSSEVLALGGILERIHDQAVLGRVINLNETTKAAYKNFDQTNMSSCLDQIYSGHEGSAQKMEFKQRALEIKSTLWRCNP